MKWPAFVRVLRGEPHRPALFVGVWAGYTLAFALLSLAALAQVLGLMAWSWTFYGLIVAKLAASSLAWVCALRRRFEIEASALSAVVSLLLFTAAIHLTGGPPSGLVALYVIEVAVLAVLASAAVGALAAVLALILYGGLWLGAAIGWPAPVDAGWAQPGIESWAFDLGLAALLLAAAAAFPGAARARLRARERALEARAGELVEATKLKAQFTANVTHELRTPLHGILGLTELLEGEIYGDVSERQRGALRGIRDSAESLLRQIDDLLEIARAESGRLELARDRFSLGEVLERVISTASWMKGNKSVAIEADIPDDLPAADSDRGKLVQVLVNLLSNAIKFTPEGGQVRVIARADEAGGGARFAVEDTGIGIPEADRERIFEAFRQAESAGDRAGGVFRRYGGVGLGLSLVRHLVGLLGGEIRVESEVGRGSRFEVWIPLSAPGEGEGAGAGAGAGEGEGEGAGEVAGEVAGEGAGEGAGEDGAPPVRLHPPRSPE